MTDSQLDITGTIKAFMVFSGYPSDGCFLVFADSSNKAKSLVSGNGSPFEWEYIDMNARRVPDYDCYAGKVKYPIVDCNQDLPNDAPPFFLER